MALSPDIVNQLRVPPGLTVRLSDHDPGWLPPHLDRLTKSELKSRATEFLASNKAELAQAQQLLYADGRHAVLIIFQAMDAAGKDGTIRHVMSGVNPQGCRVSTFGPPSSHELQHSFLWRHWSGLPARGMIGIFNRSYYEEVLVAKVRPEVLDAQRLPSAKYDAEFWERRYDDINAFERHLANSGTTILKFFLNVSKEEQRRRFLERLDNPTKHWKFSAADVAERQYWDQYQAAYEDALSATSTDVAPWYVIPADRKWAMRAAVSDIVTTTISLMDLRYPEVGPEQRRQREQAREGLLRERD